MEYYRKYLTNEDLTSNFRVPPDFRILLNNANYLRKNGKRVVLDEIEVSDGSNVVIFELEKTSLSRTSLKNWKIYSQYRQFKKGDLVTFSTPKNQGEPWTLTCERRDALKNGGWKRESVDAPAKAFEAPSN